MFRLIGAIIRPLLEHRSTFCSIGIPKVYSTGVYCCSHILQYCKFLGSQ